MPTFLEMANEMGYKSKNSISSLIEKLEQRNEIKREYSGYSRNIVLNG
jgi:SOS-response transcriptional repressor LexA